MSSNRPPALIRRARPSDAADFVRLMGAPEVLPALLQMPWPAESGWRTRLEEGDVLGKPDLHLVAEQSGQVVASAGLHPAPQLRRRHSAMLGIAVAAAWQHQGIGTALMQALCEHADQWAQLLRIELTVFSDNQAAIALYKQFGFRHEGTHVAYAMRNGVYADVWSMARLHPQPPSVGWPTL